jgi:hypothetical protein
LIVEPSLAVLPLGDDEVDEAAVVADDPAAVVVDPPAAAATVVAVFPVVLGLSLPQAVAAMISDALQNAIPSR